MRNGRRKLTGITLALLTISAIAGTISGCDKKTAPSIIESSVSQTETVPSETKKDNGRSGSVTLGEMQEIAVPFGRVSENVGYYKLGLTAKDAPDYIVKGQYAYCLSGSAGQYQFRKINIENLERSALCDITVNNGTATLLDFGIRFNTYDATIFYDFNLHEIYRTIRTVEEPNLFPYRDGYIFKEGAELRIIHLDEDKPYRMLDSREYKVMAYHSTGDNTYIKLKSMKDPESGKCSVYDVNRNVYWRNLPDNVELSDAGMVRTAGGKYIVTSFKNPRTASFPGKNPCRPGSTIFDGLKMFFFDQADRKIKYYIPSRQKICVLSEAEFTAGASLKGLYGSYVYVQYASNLYFIDSAGLNEQAGDAYNQKIKKDLALLKKNLEFKYRIKILSRKDVIKPASKDAKLEALNTDVEVLYAMNKLNAALMKFNYKFFDEFKWTKKEGICLLLSGNIDVIDGASGVEGHSFAGDNIYYIAIDVRKGDIPLTFCRELMHTIESRMANPDTIFEDWNKYNPEGFAYSEISAGSREAPYVPENEGDPSKVYFTDSYACASPYEDRARIFAAMFMPEAYGRNLSDYPCLMSKAAGVKHILLTYYPSLSESEALKQVG